MHSLVDSYMCPDRRSKAQPCHMGTKLQPTELPSQVFMCFYVFSISLWCIPKSRVSWSYGNSMFLFGELWVARFTSAEFIHFSLFSPRTRLQHQKLHTFSLYIVEYHCEPGSWAKCGGHQLQARKESAAGSRETTAGRLCLLSSCHAHATDSG